MHRATELVAIYEKLVVDSTRSSRIEDGCAEDDWDGLEAPHRQARQEGAARRRRPLRHQRRAPRAGHRRAGSPTPSSSSSTRSARSPRRSTRIRMAHRGRLPHRSSRHRSGETEDTFIADLAVATNAGQIKTGCALPLRPRRQVQPAPAHRLGARRRRRLRRQVALPSFLIRAPKRAPGIGVSPSRCPRFEPSWSSVPSSPPPRPARRPSRTAASWSTPGGGAARF